jgi:hypothetical protein
MRSFVASITLATLALLAGCSPSPTTPNACATQSDCHGSQQCIDGRCQAPRDAAIDVGADTTVADVGSDAPVPRDASADANCLPVGCAATENCFNGVDDDCDGMVDDGCSCIPGTTARCLPGRFDPSAPLCSWGEMTCTGAGEFGAWGTCTGAGGGDAGASPYGCRRIGILGAPGANPSANFQGWLQMQGAIATRFHDTATAPTLRREQLEVFDLVIVDYVQRDYTPEESTTLADWVTAGGGLFVMTGHSGSVGTVHNTLLVSLGPSYDVAHGLLSGPATLLPSALTDDGAGGTLPPVTFAGGFRVIVPASLPDLVPFATIGSDVVGVVGPFGSGQLAVFGDEWIEFDSEWSTMPPIVRLWTNSVHDLAPDVPLIPACPDH